MQGKNCGMGGGKIYLRRWEKQDLGGLEISEKGICYSVSELPKGEEVGSRRLE